MIIGIDKMLSCMVEKVGVDLQTAVDFVTINPAKNLGINKTKGSIALGKDADFTVIDPNFDIYMTVRAGKVIYRKQV
ncbi:MAG: amidohydrolase family protein [Clostridia bacterium]|nr:amidohydrolase family protein [Clostridia bacterium]